MRTIALLLITLALAGCSEAPAEPDDPIGVKPVDVDNDTGAISGVIVDMAIVPVADATITLQDGTSATSDADGLFVFESLEPGAYFLTVQADGFEPTQSSADVRAGEIAKPRIQLTPDLSPVPYVNTHEFKGHMTLSDFYAVYLVSGVLDNDLCHCTFQFTSDPDVQTVVIDTVYESSTTRVEPHDMYWDIWGGDGHDARWIESEESWHVPGSAFGPDVTAWDLQISSGEQPDIDQSFQGFISFWHVDAAPADWTFL
ncbi:MAG: carboxypeptidase-like regulatory domain-containing protein [Thermoplasmatota archaeon]